MQIPLQVTAGTSSHPELQWSDVESSHWLVSLWEEKKKILAGFLAFFK